MTYGNYFDNLVNAQSLDEQGRKDRISFLDELFRQPDTDVDTKVRIHTEVALIRSLMWPDGIAR